MSVSGQSHFSQMFGGLLKRFSAEQPQAAPRPETPQPLQAPAKMLDGTLAALQKRKAALRQERLQALGAADSVVASSAADIEKATAQIHGQIREEILALHQTLGTRLSQERLDKARVLLLELDEVISGKHGSGFESRVRGSVITEVVGRCAIAAWSSLRVLMERAKVSWPAPSGLPPWAEPKDVARASERMVNEIAEAFYKSTPSRIADRMFGIVRVWKANYPNPDSPQWRELVLQAVGYGIFAEIVAEAALKLRHDSESLMAEAMRMISSEAQSVKTVLESDQSSAEDIDRVLEQVSELCEEVIPRLAWNAVAPSVEETARAIVG